MSDPCFDATIADGIVLDTLAAHEREAHMSHAETCDGCLARLAAATQGLVSRGPDPVESPIDSEPERPGGVFAGRYVLLDTLGHGGMGVVYLAHDTVLGREVALKVLRGALAGTTEMLRGEARALAAIDHPNVVTVYDLATDGDRCAVAMERIRGTTLRQRLRRPLPRRTLVRALMDVSEGLAAAHAADVVHGDVKLDNVLVDRDHHVRIADFGLSRLVGTASVGGGTALFMAPELSQSHPTTASDQYALATCWVDALVGERPSSSAGWLPLSRRVRPRWARKPLARALGPTPAARFDDVQAFLTSLRRRRAAFIAGCIGIVVALSVGPWLAFTLDRDATQAACVDAATHDLALALPHLGADALSRSTTTTTALLWSRGVFAYAAWRTNRVAYQGEVCAGQRTAADEACHAMERRWIERSLRNLDPARPGQKKSIVEIATIEFIASERLCDDPREAGTIARFEASGGGAGVLGELSATLTLALGPSASIAELDAAVAALGPDRPSRLLVLALLARATVLQQARQVAAALADAEQALEVAARLRRRELQSLAATMLGGIEIQQRGDILHARQWARLARALSTDSTMVGNQRGIAELEANIGLVSGNATDVVAAVDELYADPLGPYAAGPRLVTLRGLALVELGDLAQAEATLRLAFDARVDEAFVDASRIAGGLNNLAALARANGDDFGAYLALEDAARLRAYLPADHPDRLTLDRARLRFDAEVFADPASLSRAEQLAADTQRLFPAHHPDTIAALTLVAELTHRFGDPTLARAIARDVADRVAQHHLRGVLGALPFIVLAELDHDDAALAEALRRLGPLLATAPICARIRPLAATLAAPSGPCATARTTPR